jgi:NAD-dependent SIR2 family protein deacetylase
MTIQKRTLISLKNVIGVEYECNHCHARFAVPIDRMDRPAMTCPNCREPWFNRDINVLVGAASQDIVQYFAQNLKALQSESRES